MPSFSTSQEDGGSSTISTADNSCNRISLFESPESLYSPLITPRMSAEAQVASGGLASHLLPDYSMSFCPNPELISTLPNPSSHYPVSKEPTPSASIAELQKFTLLNNAPKTAFHGDTSQQHQHQQHMYSVSHSVHAFGAPSFANCDNLGQSAYCTATHPSSAAFISPVASAFSYPVHGQYNSTTAEPENSDLYVLLSDTGVLAEFSMHRADASLPQHANHHPSSIPASHVPAGSLQNSASTPGMFAFPILSNADTVLNITSAATDMPIFVPAEQDLGKESSSISNSTAHCHSEFLSGVAVTPQPAYTEYMRGAFDGPMLNPTTTPAAYSSVAIDSTAFPANTESAIVAGISTSGLARLSGVGDRSRRVKRMGRRRSLSLSGCIRGHPGSSGMCPAASESQTSIHTSFASHAGTLPPSCQQSPLASPRLGHVGRRRHRAGSESVARSYKKSILGCSPQGSVFGDSDAGLSTRTAKQRLRAHTISQGFKKLSIRSNSSSPTKGSSRNSGANKQLSATDDESCNMKAGSHDEKQEESAGAGTRGQTVSGRIPLTDEQRREYFLWLYRNAHDPKPKGKERERLRAIGNMSRERFKTWFANARRRYFRITENNGIQRYVINSRFKDACKRANIQLN